MGDLVMSNLSLSELCDAIVDCEHKTANTQSSGIPSIRTTNIKNGRIDFKNANRVSFAVYKEWTARLEPQPNDLILAREAPVGEVGIIPFNQKACLGQRTVLIRPNQQRIYPKYLLYLLLTPEMRYEMNRRAEGSTVPHLNMLDIRNLAIPKLPPLPEQKAIAHILGTLDDKIELNQQMNQTLEAIAKAIFKSWFVDFDPVRAKMEGRQPVGMDAATAELFPDSFEESALGLIPKGWRVGTLSELGNITSGKRPKERSSIATSEMNIPLYGGGGIMAYVKEPLYNYPILATGRVGTLGIVFRITKSCWTSDNTLVILSKNQEFYEYLYFQLKYIDVISLNRGSTQPLVTQSDLKNQEFAIPSQELLKEFHFLTSSLFNKLDANTEQSETLANIRNTLLPKLMSGEIRVKEAESIIEEAV
jgi:type I restriction enzyme S subunit